MTARRLARPARPKRAKAAPMPETAGPLTAEEELLLELALRALGGDADALPVLLDAQLVSGWADRRAWLWLGNLTKRGDGGTNARGMGWVHPGQTERQLHVWRRKILTGDPSWASPMIIVAGAIAGVLLFRQWPTSWPLTRGWRMQRMTDASRRRLEHAEREYGAGSEAFLAQLRMLRMVQQPVIILHGLAAYDQMPGTYVEVNFAQGPGADADAFFGAVRRGSD